MAPKIISRENIAKELEKRDVPVEPKAIEDAFKKGTISAAFYDVAMQAFPFDLTEGFAESGPGERLIEIFADQSHGPFLSYQIEGEPAPPTALESAKKQVSEALDALFKAMESDPPVFPDKESEEMFEQDVKDFRGRK